MSLYRCLGIKSRRAHLMQTGQRTFAAQIRPNLCELQVVCRRPGSYFSLNRRHEPGLYWRRVPGCRKRDDGVRAIPPFRQERGRMEHRTWFGSPLRGDGPFVRCFPRDSSAAPPHGQRPVRGHPGRRRTLPRGYFRSILPGWDSRACIAGSGVERFELSVRSLPAHRRPRRGQTRARAGRWPPGLPG
jgi:hypothetical protein